MLYQSDMYNNRHTAKCHSNLANEICCGGVPSLAEAVSVCVDSLKIVCGKCALPMAIAGFVMPYGDIRGASRCRVSSLGVLFNPIM